MLDRLQRHAQQLDGYTELRWHVNHATRLTMRKGALLQNGQSREGGVSARCYRSGAFGSSTCLAPDTFCCWSSPKALLAPSPSLSALAQPRADQL